MIRIPTRAPRPLQAFNLCRAPASEGAHVRIPFWQVKAIGVNMHDTYVRTGLYPSDELPVIIGAEAVGTISSVGPDVTELAIGDRVASFEYGTAYTSRMHTHTISNPGVANARASC